MSRVLLLDHDETRHALPFDELLMAVRTALVATSRQETSAPPRIAAFSPGGLLGAMPGYVPGLGLGGKLTSVFSVAGTEGRSRHGGIVALFDESDGTLQAIMSAEAVTAARTAACATAAFGALSPPDVQRIAVVGAGVQGNAQLELLAHLGLSAQVVVATRDPRSAAATAEHHQVRAAPSIRAAVSGADLVLCCTDADSPVIDREWLRPGAHVSSVGGSRGPELDDATVMSGALFIEWPGAVSCPPPAGAHELQRVPAGRAHLIGAVLSGEEERPPGELTVFKSTGYAALDVAAAATAFARASERGLGSSVSL